MDELDKIKSSYAKGELKPILKQLEVFVKLPQRTDTKFQDPGRRQLEETFRSGYCNCFYSSRALH